MGKTRKAKEAKPDSRPETVTVTLPWAKMPTDSVGVISKPLPRNIKIIRLSPEAGRALAQLHTAVKAQGIKTKKGYDVETYPQVIRYLLEQIGDSNGKDASNDS